MSIIDGINGEIAYLKLKKLSKNVYNCNFFVYNRAS